MTMTKIYVQTPKGSKLHGEIIGNDFVRKVEGKDVRWSDRSFTINSDAIRQIKNVDRCVFEYSMASKIETRSMSLDGVMKCRVVINEQGEKNIRIPIDSCHLDKSTPIIGKVVSKPDSLAEFNRKRIEKAKEDNPQKSLF